jgi:hypothetical protein
MMEKILTENQITKIVDLMTAIYQEGKAEDNELIIAYVKDVLDVLSSEE